MAAALRPPSNPGLRAAWWLSSINGRPRSMPPAFSWQRPPMRLSGNARGPKSRSGRTQATRSPNAMAGAQGAMSLEYLQNSIGFISPLTIVVPPLFSFPRSPRPFFRFVWKTLKYKLLDFGGYFATMMSSKPSMFRTARFRLDRKSILPTAKALHRAFSEAVAAGDTQALRAVTTDTVYNEYAGAIRRRPPGRSFSWELVRYDKPMWLPRVTGHRIMPLPRPDSASVAEAMPQAAVHQVVVTIASRQRLVPYKKRRDGEKMPIEEKAKEVDVVEHVALTRVFDMRTYKATGWRVAGTVNQSSLESIEEDERLIKSMEEEQMAKYKSAR